MNVIYSLDRTQGLLFDASGRRLDPQQRAWLDISTPATGELVDSIAAATWLQRHSGAPVRVPVGVIGPREASGVQLLAAEQVGHGLASMGFVVICGGRGGVMEAVCRGAAGAGGMSIGLLPDADPRFANPHVGIVIATGIGEARNALIARASLCLVAIGDSFGTLSEVALSRQFGKRVIGLEGAARVEGVLQVATVAQALGEVAQCALAV
ncbi:MAG: lysine decarboxylase [Rhodoferax sp.]|uniref:SLOG cluster 4 domain-containing protein n=1 Tax=Rhodoferax sp. TaxID=50421 RepID=UPI0027164949|nr:lysine decarboxylase [Rhodoferax sp.]MDO8449022.1 lysine decarboxylase [Rhodoferax sp.]